MTPLPELGLSPNEARCLDALAAGSVEYLVVGGHAVRVHGSERHTKDLDVLVSNSAENAVRIVAALAQLGIVHPNLQPDAIAGMKRQINCESWGFHFEIITAADGIEFAAALHESVVAKAGTLKVPVVSRRDLITMKRLAGRPIDLEDVVFLESPPNKSVKRTGDR